ncbi:MAG: ATP-binding protein [Flavicella sp.]|nr:ATP-binding protein [Flavicella sp.]
MSRFFNFLTSKSILFFFSFALLGFVLWNSYDFSKKFKIDQRSQMEILAKVYDRFGTADLSQDLSLEAKIIESNYNIPMIVTDGKGLVLMKRNLDSIKALDSIYLSEQLLLMKSENEPVVISYLKDKKYVIYYRDSDLLTRLKYYPLALFLMMFLFSGVIYMVFRTSKVAEQNKLWSGIAKETAHQIGTPLSSLMGWVELMKLQNTAMAVVPELEKDIDRLNTIADRFSKIGSTPTLAPLEICAVVQNTVSYFQARSSKSIVFQFEKPIAQVWVQANEQLFGWVLENLIKNAIDAMSGRGTLTLEISPKESGMVAIFVADTGKGIPRKLQKKVFKPGFTTRARGWGLGLSLSKRIVENYHSGKLVVKKSELGKGTTFAVQLKQLPATAPVVD